MANTITLTEPDVNNLMTAYIGLQVERASTRNGSFTLLVQLPYVASETIYTYLDASGVATDWYRSVRYGPDGLLGAYSAAWPVTARAVPGLTLADIEREVARRVGPFYQLPMDRQLPSTAQFDRAYVPGLRSTVEQDLVTNLWLLRRGVDSDGNVVPVALEDRQRTVANYDPQQGLVEVDRPWSVQPAAGEVCEFHHLDPLQELRPAVLGGLRRCWFEDRFSLGQGYVYEVDLTAALPWLNNQRDVLSVQAGPFPSNGLNGGPSELPFETFVQGGNVCVRLNGGSYGPYYGGVLVTLRRSHCFFVNGIDAPDGPIYDDDVLEVDLDYAASAGHIEAWHTRPAKLQAAAVGGLQATQAMAALEFTRQSLIWGPRRQRGWGFKTLPRTSTVVVNA